MERCFCCSMKGASVIVLLAGEFRVLVCERCAQGRK